MATEDRDYMRENVGSTPGELRPEIPWTSASRMSDEEYKSWLSQKVERPWLTILVAVLLGALGLYLSGDAVMQRFVHSF